MPAKRQPVLLTTNSKIITLTIALCMLLVSSLLSMPASPELIEQLREAGTLDRIAARIAEAKSLGVDAAKLSLDKNNQGQKMSLQFDPEVADTFQALLILVDFVDNPASGGMVFGQPSDFDHLIFSDDPGDQHYSVTEFYRDNSYGNFYLKGTVVGWYRMPQTYAYYVDGQNGFGSYPQNAQRMAYDAVQAANPDVNYADFDIDNNGWLDGVFVVHAGQGAEATGSDFMIWSHQWNMPTVNLDGVNISAYTTEPEEYSGGNDGLVTMGVFAHEYGHFLGLPDLYDTDYSSEGVGDWSLMAGGSWNQGGRYPAYMDVWCKKEVGFITVNNVITNMIDVDIPASYYNPVAYAISPGGLGGSEYFLVENRRKVGNDIGIPGSGLLIFHINESNWGNSNEPNYLVGVEQADGLFELENNVNEGNDKDLWSTYTQTDFDDLSLPNSRNQAGFKTKTAVWNISSPDSVMVASFDISYSRPRYELLSGEFSDAALGDGDGVVDLGEQITFTFSLTNLWLDATNVTATLSSDNNDIVFPTPTVNIGAVSGEGGSGGNLGSPLVFEVPADFSPCVDSFFLEISSDNGYDTKVFGFELNVGTPDVLVIDDDNGDSWEQAITLRLFNIRVPYDVWSVADSGAPSAALLNGYGTVMWTIGNARADILSAADVAAMTSFMDGGGNFFLTGQAIIDELNIDDQTFLNNYLKAEYIAEQIYPFMIGQTGTALGDGIKFRFGTPTNQSEPAHMSAINGGVAEFNRQDDLGATVISYNGTYKLVLMSFGFEAITDAFQSTGWVPGDTVFNRIMEFFYPSTESTNPIVDPVALTGEVSTNVISLTPTFEWTVNDTTANPIIEYQVRLGTGDLCHNSDNMWDPGIISGTATSIVYAGFPLEDGADYVFQVRVNNGDSWSEWAKEGFHVNRASGVGFIVEPKDDQQVTTSIPELNQTIAIDPEGDVLTYSYEVYSDPSLTTLVASVDGVPQGSPTTKWTVDLPLNEDQQYFWRGRNHDGYEYSPYTEVESFYVNAANNAPGVFDLATPVDNSFTPDIYPRLIWHHAPDSDPADSIRYTLWTSTDETFASYVETADLKDSTRVLTYALVDGQTYFWKVLATDLAAAATWSTSTFKFTVGSGCCIGMRGNANGDLEDKTNISDVTFLVSYLFGIPAGPAPSCLEEANANGDPEEKVNISDVTYLTAYLFGVPTGPPPPDCQ